MLYATRRNSTLGLAILLMIALSLGTVGCQDKMKAEPQTPKTEAKDKEATPNPFGVTVTLEEYPAWIKKHLEGLKWKTRDSEKKLTRQNLLDSFHLGRTFMLNNQKPAGNFNYQYDFVLKEQDKDDNQVRQAGALWGVALMYQYEQEEKSRKALILGLKFFFDNTREGPVEDTLVVAYPGDANTSSGTVALVAMSIIEYLRTEKDAGVQIPAAYRKELVSKLDGYLAFLKWMKLENKHFSRSYSLLTKSKVGSHSPYFDGEIMLCLIKAAKYLDYKDLVPVVEDSALTLAKYYTVDAWRKDPDSDQTKGFFQWSCMAFYEYQDAGYKNSEALGDYVLSLGWWMLHTHHTLKRSRNTAYAYEGIIRAYMLAKSRNMTDAANDLAYTIDRGIYKLTSWQVSGPLQSRNKFLTDNPTSDPLAVGGIMNHKRQAPLRIDVTQHQMHAVTLALEFVYTQ